MKSHEAYIKRCIQIAKNGLGTTRPNPMVGCVIVHQNQIIGEGFTSPYGGSHAEVNAIQSVKNKTLLQESTLYVTLEPCSHFGKTPPCSFLIVEHKIPCVVIGCQDDNPEVSGKGIAHLKSAGCEVVVGVLKNECKLHHKRFFTFHNEKRPYIILKWAQSKDGFIAPSSKNMQGPVWISNSVSRQLVHKWRSEEHAILVGTKTVTEDNPSLTVRDWTGSHPLRIVIDQKNKLPRTLNVFDDQMETLVVSEEIIDFENPIGKQIADLLYQRKITSVIIEGGRRTLETFIEENLWDEARIFYGKENLINGIQAPCLSKNATHENDIASDRLKYYYND
ncbi:MAG: bifunctional diaminohydroxyphosphoribosylaminopyrimidine deaminase/5-amino-6-(5-phosphoribosylamino)uracil reductase RibD [Flavobacteriaceae bacterium]|nr:bifunctional diaminohydroxyphosphoribosylaminopyrimidine deaminase/5-amino-6-(5-phosphoribosylamino)uracil reductase RibD [Flavobacteriaceae bacterium]NNK59593.1 bifunctional diaminohydroxyphosphoribosylaminopyrimidine deaminase/5-amino-6-(5-phosphoribosylamino)uracil reductase RibD [Flavobacteriaceae bacterium]